MFIIDFENQLNDLFEDKFKNTLNNNVNRYLLEQEITNILNNLFCYNGAYVEHDVIYLDKDIDMYDVIAILPYSGLVSWHGYYYVKQCGKTIANVQYLGKARQDPNRPDTVFVGAEVRIEPFQAIDNVEITLDFEGWLKEERSMKLDKFLEKPILDAVKELDLIDTQIYTDDNGIVKGVTLKYKPKEDDEQGNTKNPWDM